MIAHDVLTYLCGRDVGLSDKPIRITPYTYGDMDTALYNSDFPLEMREGKRPTVTSEEPEYDENDYYTPFVHYDEPRDGTVPAIQVLSLYSVEPDWGMDFGLRLSPLQSLMGGSQGYRHLRYSLCFLRAGVAHKRTLYFHSLSNRAFRSGDVYWGVRFAARAIHYIEDMLTPFHTKPFPESFLLKKMLNPKGLFFITYNYHMNFERFSGYHLWHGRRDFIDPIQAAQVFPIRRLGSVLFRNWNRMRALFYPLFRECRKLWGDTMINGPFRLNRDDVARINPHGPLLEATQKWLESAASVVKGYIVQYVIPSMKDATG
jgi:hypothetical protein